MRPLLSSASLFHSRRYGRGGGVGRGLGVSAVLGVGEGLGVERRRSCWSRLSPSVLQVAVAVAVGTWCWRWRRSRLQFK